MSPDNPVQPTPPQQATNPPVATDQPPTIVQPQPLSPQPKGKSKARLVGIILLVILAIILLIGGLTYAAYTGERSAGLKRAAEHVALLEANNITALKDEAITMLGVDENTSDPEDQEKIVAAGTQIGFLTTILKEADAVKYDDIFGVTPDGKQLVTAYYKITVPNGNTAYYTVAVRKDADAWVLHSLEVSETDPVTRK